MAKMGRPRIEIDQNQFEKLCSIMCTKQEIAGWFNVSEDTLERWCKRTFGQTFAVISEQKRQAGRISLRRAGFQLAQKVPSVHIFYCKNHLGMSDHNEADDEKQDERVDRLIEAIKSV